MDELENTNQQETAISDEQKRLTGIGGLLILVIIGLCGVIVLNGMDLYDYYTGWADYQALTSYGVDTAPLNICALIDVATIVFALVALYCILTKNRNTRNVMLVYYVFAIVGTIIYLEQFRVFELSLNTAAGSVISNFAQEEMTKLGGQIGWAIIWMIYWIRSKRVKYTFKSK